jgi:hypothetical protein
MTKVEEAYTLEKTASYTIGVGKTPIYTCKVLKLDPHFSHCTKITLKLIKPLGKTWNSENTMGENMENSWRSGISSKFFNKTQKAQEIRVITDNGVSSNWKLFTHQKKQPSDWRLPIE